MGAFFVLVSIALFRTRGVMEERYLNAPKAGMSALLDGRACLCSVGRDVGWLVSGSFAANMLSQF